MLDLQKTQENKLMSDSIATKVKTIIAEKISVDVDSLEASKSFTEDLGADSLDVVEMVMGLEEAFDVEIPDEAAEKIATVDDAIKYLENLKVS